MVTEICSRARRVLTRAIAWRYCLLAGLLTGQLASAGDDVVPQLLPAVGAGSLVIAGGGELPPAIIDRFLELGGGADAHLVVITTASVCAEWPAESQPHQRLWASRPRQSLTLLHTRDRAVADTEAFCKPLSTATAVWFVGGDQNQLTRTYLDTRTEAALHSVLRRGGVIGGTSAGAAIMSRVMITGGRSKPNLGDGLGFLPGTIIDQHFLKRNRQPRLMAALEQRPGHVGIGIDENTAVVVRRHSLEVVGNSEAMLCLAPSHNRPAMSQPIRCGESLDLQTWRLAATGRARFGSYAQAQEHPAPNLQQGTVVITGGQAPKAAVDEFLAAAGGKDAPVVLISQMSEENETARQQLADAFRAAGAENFQVCQTGSRDEVLDPAVSELLAQARGVWLLSDQEQQFLDLILHSPLRQLVTDVLERGGAIGGSSAAARLHGAGIIRRQPMEDEQALMAEAYECGLGLLPGMVIDAHSEPEPETSTMATALRERFPNCVGVGLKDSSAVIVRGHTFQVVGSAPVSVMGSPMPMDAEKSTYDLVQAGQVYDLRTRRVMPIEVEAEAETH